MLSCVPRPAPTWIEATEKPTRTGGPTFTANETGAFYTGRATLIAPGQGGAADIAGWDDTTLTTFGTPLDVTLDELAVELFFPADDATEAAMRARELESG